jgi:Golgi nucleoside diphosphatase
MKEQVPEKDWEVTPIWLKATAGLRMLEPAKSEAVLASVRTFLSNKANSPFLFRPSFAKIIPGNEEGGFGWIAYNYLKRIIGPKRHPDSLETPFAVVEMGGASSQVSQVAPNAAAAAAIPEHYRFTFTIEKDTYQLYTHSYLGFGAEQGREKLNKVLSSSASAANPVKDPCLYSGYTRSVTDPITEPYQGPAGWPVVGGENPLEEVCVASLQSLFKSLYNAAASLAGAPAAPAVTTDPVCDPTTQPGPHSFGCVYQPDFVLQSANFLVFENFYYMASGLGVKSVKALNTVLNGTVSPFPLRTTPTHIKEATNKACDTDWATLQATYPLDNQPKDVNLKMCFSGSYAYSFLVDGLKVDKDKVLTIQKEVGPSEIEWALGAAYKEAADLLKRTNLRPT